MCGSVNGGMCERFESPTIRVVFRTVSDQSWSFLKVLGCLCGSGHSEEPGGAVEPLLGFRVDNSDVGDEVSLLLFIVPFIIMALLPTLALALVLAGPTVLRDGSLRCLGGESVGEQDRMVLLQGRATLLDR